MIQNNNMCVYKPHILKQGFNMIKETCLFSLDSTQSLLPWSTTDSHTPNLLINVTSKNK
jgi:hypothetical protein